MSNGNGNGNETANAIAFGEGVVKTTYQSSISFVLLGVAIVAALAWAGAAQAFIGQFVKTGNNKPTASLIYAVLVTFVAVLITQGLNKVTNGVPVVLPVSFS